jgi:hypothetical protein
MVGEVERDQRDGRTRRAGGVEAKEWRSCRSYYMHLAMGRNTWRRTGHDAHHSRHRAIGQSIWPAERQSPAHAGDEESRTGGQR